MGHPKFTVLKKIGHIINATIPASEKANEGDLISFTKAITTHKNGVDYLTDRRDVTAKIIGIVERRKARGNHAAPTDFISVSI